MSREAPKGERAKTEFYRALAVEELVRLLRQGDYDALQEFTARYAPLLLNHAERAGFAVADLETVVADLLSDIAVSLIVNRHWLPRCTMETYVVRCFRKRLASIHRQSTREVSAQDDMLDAQDATGCSEATIFSSAGADCEPVPLAPVLERLASMLDEGLSAEERDLLASVSEYASQSDIAEWLGMSHDAVRKQLERLRKRLRMVARRYVDALTDKERAEVRRFFARVRAIIEPDPPPTSHTLPKAAGDDR